ncbi:MAG: TraB/GumN family protein [Verrucomicrobia bacterium]|nr:MAG: TraB/GumN family protein [Verrucomicrobiota bacterium]
MKRLRLFLLLAAFGAGLFQLHAATSLWRVSSGETSLYLGGTFHLLRASDFPLPEAFDAAYADSTTVVFETDLGAMQSPQVQQRMLAQCALGGGETLRALLSPEVYAKLEAHCQKAGLALAAMEGFKPALVVITLAVVELQKVGIAEEGVDMHYYNRAQADGKAVRGLETPQEQIDFICSMGEGDEDAFVLHAIRDLEESVQHLPELITAWRRGDLETLEREFVSEMKRDFPRLYRSLLVERNRAWLPKIEALLETAETELVLVGGAHLPGEDGLLAQLQARGYRVEQFDIAAAPAP